MHNTLTSAFASTTAADNYLGLLLDRILLDVPITLGYGDRTTITYNIEMQMPWASI
jgi:hypothetical protein